MKEAVADDEWRDAILRGRVHARYHPCHGRALLRVNEDTFLRGFSTAGIPR
jgi:hypothetical protein